MKPEKMPNPSEKAVEKFEELEFVFPEAGMPEDVDLPDLPEMGATPSAPALPELSLPDEAYVEIDIPSAHLPTEIFDII